MWGCVVALHTEYYFSCQKRRGGALCGVLGTHKGIQNSITKLRGLSPQANYTDRATAVSWRS
jgi:hypothetical protein